jgi:DNA invertase Pin-like site-specific DNA recombinase
MIRFSILAGVSSDPQAREEKASIEDQIKTCRRVVEQLDGYEVAVYIMDGYWRTGYDSLAEAMQDIPPLKEAVEAAEAGKYDVLIMDNFDRLGDLGQLVNTRFKKYKRQLYSARQSGRVHDPENYDPYSDESSDIAMHVEGIIQRYRLNKLRRGLILGIRKRVEEGQYSTTHPYGYRKGPNRGGNLRLDPTVATLLIQLKDEFLRGTPLQQLVKFAQTSGVPAPRGPHWHRYTIKRTLTNPFYAGKVFSGRWKTVGYKRSPKTGKRSPIMKLNTDVRELRDGNHEPLWTWEEHLRIVQEMEDRYKRYPRHDTHNFSGLMQCTICGKRVYFRGRKYRCQSAPDHIGLKEAEANRLIGQALANALRDYKAEEPELNGRRPKNHSKESVAEFEKRSSMIQHHVETDSGMYTAKEAVEKINSLRAQIKKVEDQRDAQKHQEAVHQRRLAQRAGLLPKLHLLPHLFAQEDPAVNNRLLRDILETI